MRAALFVALDNPERSSPQLAEQAAVWAQDPARLSEEESAERAGSDAVLSAALITVRDGTDELRAKHGAWAESILINALASKGDVGQRMRSGLNFNPSATAFVGLCELYRRSRKLETLRLLFEIAARENPAGAHGFAVVVRQLADLDERLIKSILRCALTACVRPSYRWDVSELERERRADAYRVELARAVDGELAWLSDTQAEPSWPEFATVPARSRRREIRIGGPLSAEPPEPETVPPETYVDAGAAALWLRCLRPILDVTARPWLLDVARGYCDFTSKRNGAGLDPDEEISNLRRSDEWNGAYYELVARALEALSRSEIEALAISPITALPDESFFDVAPHLLRPIDVIFFNDRKLAVEATLVRSAFARRLAESRGWKRLAGDKSVSIELHIGPCIGSLFFNDYVLRQTRSYLTPGAIERIDPFLPTLSALAKSGPHFFVALVTLDLLEVTPRVALLPFGIEAAEAWLGSYPESTIFWISNGIGRRFCEWLSSLCSVAPDALKADSPDRARIDRVLAALVQLGLPQARQLESALSKS
jgi:hypothetical protein